VGRNAIQIWLVKCGHKGQEKSGDSGNFGEIDKEINQQAKPSLENADDKEGTPRKTGRTFIFGSWL